MGGLGPQVKWCEGVLGALSGHVVLSAEAALLVARRLVGQDAAAEEPWE